MPSLSTQGIEIRADPSPPDLLTDDAAVFLADLERRFGPDRLKLLEARRTRQQALAAGERPDLRPETASIRKGDWRVQPAPADLRDRRVEITGPTDRKMMIHALNSGAQVYMADFEDAACPTWENLVAGQQNLIDYLQGRLEVTTDQGTLKVQPAPATLVVRPRGWHLEERHVLVEGRRMSASLFDAGLFLFHNARALLRRSTAPYFYLPKLESHEEARLWARVFAYSEDRLGLRRGTIRATVLIETILAAFEMDEILYELRDHAVGLNAGRWDYIFSIIKKFRHDPDFQLPDRSAVTMDVPFMRAYARLLVNTCHRRGAHAIGGMAAFVPNRRDPELNARALDKVRSDKDREVRDGFDGTWVAHPDLVAVARSAFDEVLQGRSHQLEMRPEQRIEPRELLDVRIPEARITRAGVENNVSVGLRYVDAWLRGRGAVALYNLMEDTATAEIARAQLYQWTRHHGAMEGGEPVTRELVETMIDDEVRAIGSDMPGGPDATLAAASELFRAAALDEPFAEFLTLSAYERLE